ncbi:hypothetical protein [Cupriavidus sp. TMH.W2]|uniref:hypothetical protein n=1 Tax=Cupriavidus sp. TMH.W2 TaxID=3434465 RepID=UPI003D77DF35
MSTRKPNLIQKAIVSASLLTASGMAAGWGCPAVVDSIWQAGIAASATTVSGSLAAMLESYAASRTLNGMRVQSALKILAQQINVSTEKDTTVNLAAKQGLSSVMADLSQREAVHNTMLDFNASTGQGFDPCGEVRRSQSVAVAIGEAATDMQTKVIRELDTAPGRVVKDQAPIYARRLQDAKGIYCTAAEAAAGLCASAGQYAGFDVDASNFFASADANSPQTTAKNAFLNNIFGAPRSAISAETAKTPAGQAYLEAKRSEDAIRSVSQASLKGIQAWTERRGDGEAGQSVLDALQAKVGTYAGGDNYEEWAKSKAAMSSRGLLVELAKMEATGLNMLYETYQAAGRTEALTAAWLAASTRTGGVSGRAGAAAVSDSASQRANESAARAKVQ